MRAVLKRVIIVGMLCGALVGAAQRLPAHAEYSLHPDWVVASTMPAMDIYDVVFTDELDGWVTSDNGALYVTHDGGQTWTFQVTHTSDTLDRIEFLDAQHGYAVGGETILYTTDSGATWHPTPSAPSGYHAFDDIAAPAPNILYVADDPNDPYIFEPGIFVSTDDGQTWNALPNAPSGATRLVFTDANTGWAISNDNLYETTDGGLTWTDLYSGFQTLQFLSASLAFATTTNGSLIMSTDGGANWSSVPSPSTASPVSTAFQSETTGLVTTGSDIWATQDGGQTWANQTIPINVASVSFVGFRGTVPYAVSSSGQFLQYSPPAPPTSTPTATALTTNTPTGTATDTPTATATASPTQTPVATDTSAPGVPTTTPAPSNTATQTPTATATATPVLPTQTPTTTPVPPTATSTPSPLYPQWNVQSSIPGGTNDVAFIDALNGWAVGNGGMYVTHDGGHTWSYQVLPTTGLQHIEFTDAQHGYALGGGAILFTADGGVTWHPMPSEPSGYHTFADLAAPAPNTLYVADDPNDYYEYDPKIYVSTDNGQTWNALPNSPPGATRLIFTDANTGWALDGSDLYETTDGGLTWTDLLGGQLGTFDTMAFPAPDKAYLGGYDGRIEVGQHLTTRGGETFSSVSVSTSQQITSLAFPNVNAGLATDGSAIYATQNGGATWQTQTLPLDESSPVVVVGYRGAIPFAVTQDGDFLVNGAAMPTPTLVPSTSTPAPPPTWTPVPPPAIPTVTPPPTPTSPPTAPSPTRTPQPLVAPLPPRHVTNPQPSATPTPPTGEAEQVPDTPTPEPAHHGHPTPHQPLHVQIVVPKGRLSGNAVVPIQITTSSRAVLFVTLKLRHTVVVMTGTGKHRHPLLTGKGKQRHEVTRTVQLYQTGTRTQAGRRGHATVHMRVGYNPVSTVKAQLIVTVQGTHATSTQTLTVTIAHQAPPHPHKKPINHKHH